MRNTLPPHPIPPPPAPLSQETSSELSRTGGGGEAPVRSDGGGRGERCPGARAGLTAAESALEVV